MPGQWEDHSARRKDARNWTAHMCSYLVQTQQQTSYLTQQWASTYMRLLPKLSLSFSPVNDTVFPPSRCAEELSQDMLTEHTVVCWAGFWNRKEDVR